MDVGASAMWAGSWIDFLANFRTAIGAIPHGNAVSPPKLTGNAPIPDVFHPVEVGVFVAFGVESDVAIPYCLDGRFGKRLHFYKPLLGNNWFYRCVATVATANVVFVWLYLLQNAHFLEFGNNLLATFVAIQTCKFTCKFVHCVSTDVGYGITQRELEKWGKMNTVVRMQ